MDECSEKLEQFAASYVEGGCASKAAAKSSITLFERPPSSGCYVYLLLCPEGQRILYVGKGTGRRMHMHVREVRSGVVTAAKKFKALHEFISLGETPKAVAVFTGLSGVDAFRMERRLIARIGVQNLANALPGQVSINERLLAKLAWLRTRRKPFCRWLIEHKPAPEQIGIYAKHAEYMREIEKKVRDAAA